MAQHAVLERNEAALSGNRWSARLEGSPLRLEDDQSGYDGAIDSGNRKVDRHHRRRRREGARHGCGGQANRAEIIDSTVVVVTRLLVGTQRCDGRDQDSGTVANALAVDRVNVTEGHGKIDGERDQRSP